MDVEEGMVAFGETALWVECDLCGRAFGGPSLTKTIVAVGQANVCVDCVRKSRRKWGTSTEGVGCRGPQFQVGVDSFLCFPRGSIRGLMGFAHLTGVEGIKPDYAAAKDNLARARAVQ
jgi:hypothetical protein